MRKYRILALALLVGLLLRFPCRAVDSISGLDAGLKGKTLLVLGDSYTAGYHLESLSQSWNSILAASRGMTELNYAITGSSVAAGEKSFSPMVERCRELPADANPDIILFQGGSNDYSRGIPLGEDEDRNPETFCGAVNLVLETLAEKYPAAAVVGFTPWISDDTENAEGQIQQDYTDAMLRIFSAHGLACFDASDLSLSGVAMDDKEFRAKYALAVTDWYHLGPEGHAMFAPVMAGWLETELYALEPADRYYDLAGADLTLRTAVNGLQGILEGESERLFAPTQAVTRGLLAQSLYHMAGDPRSSNRELLDVDPQEERYPAICWAMDTGLFTPGDTFGPDQTVNRQMLSAVLCRWYTEYLGEEVMTLQGLGSFSDGLLTAAYAKTSLGWALSAGVMEAVDGKVRPLSNVSRGELARSLYALMNLP